MRILDAGRVFLDDEGRPAAGGSAYFYSNGTTTKKAVYIDAALSVESANPVSLNSEGRLPNEVFGTGSYSVRVIDVNGGTVWAEDDVPDRASNLIDDFANAKDYGALGDGTTDDTDAIAAARAASEWVWLPEGTYLTSTRYGYTDHFFGPGTLRYTGGANHDQFLGQIGHYGDYRNIGGEANAVQSGGVIVGSPVGQGKGLLMGAQEHPFWQIWRGVGDDGSLHWDYLPNVPVVNAQSATHNAGADTKLVRTSTATNNFSDSTIWAVGQLIHFNLEKYRIKELLDDDEIVLGTDSTTPAAVAFTSAVTDNVVAPVFYWDVTATISSTTLTITGGDHPPQFSNYDMTNNRVYALISGTWIQVTAVASSTSMTLGSAPGNGTNVSVKLRLEPDYTVQIGLKRASGQGLEETLRIESHHDSYLFRSTGSGVAVTKPILFQVETTDAFFIGADGDLFGFGTATPNDFLHLNSNDANSDVVVRMVNDVQNWRFGTFGSNSDRFVIRDGTGGGNVVVIDTSSPANSVHIQSDRVSFASLLQAPAYTVATLPSAVAGGIIYVSDETGGATLAFSDGTNWRRVQDRAIVS